MVKSYKKWVLKICLNEVDSIPGLNGFQEEAFFGVVPWLK